MEEVILCESGFIVPSEAGATANTSKKFILPDVTTSTLQGISFSVGAFQNIHNMTFVYSCTGPHYQLVSIETKHYQPVSFKDQLSHGMQVLPLYINICRIK